MLQDRLDGENVHQPLPFGCRFGQGIGRPSRESRRILRFPLPFTSSSSDLVTIDPPLLTALVEGHEMNQARGIILKRQHISKWFLNWVRGGAIIDQSEGRDISTAWYSMQKQ
jgi:hypothetical protein